MQLVYFHESLFREFEKFVHTDELSTGSLGFATYTKLERQMCPAQKAETLLLLIHLQAVHIQCMTPYSDLQHKLQADSQARC
jgi:hypothetical protein